MSNTYFQFKQFIIHQERCAMKVCTDACLFGAWLADSVGSQERGIESILDIGTGTGLLSMMLAQKTAAHIDAIELDEHAAEQAAENFEASLWKDRMQVIRADARTVHLGRKYELIISNPPFFENDLKTVDTRRNLALHSKALNLEELLAVIKKHLADNGQFAVLLPYPRRELFTGLAIEAGYFPAEEVLVKQTPNHPFFRSILVFTAEEVAKKSCSIVVQGENEYTPEFVYFLKDYYLKL